MVLSSCAPNQDGNVLHAARTTEEPNAFPIIGCVAAMTLSSVAGTSVASKSRDCARLT